MCCQTQILKRESLVSTVDLLLRYCPAQVIIVSFNLSWILGARGCAVGARLFSIYSSKYGIQVRAGRQLNVLWYCESVVGTLFGTKFVYYLAQWFCEWVSNTCINILYDYFNNILWCRQRDYSNHVFLLIKEKFGILYQHLHRSETEIIFSELAYSRMADYEIQVSCFLELIVIQHDNLTL